MRNNVYESIIRIFSSVSFECINECINRVCFECVNLVCLKCINRVCGE